MIRLTNHLPLKIEFLLTIFVFGFMLFTGLLQIVGSWTHSQATNHCKGKIFLKES